MNNQKSINEITKKVSNIDLSKSKKKLILKINNEQFTNKEDFCKKIEKICKSNNKVINHNQINLL